MTYIKNCFSRLYLFVSFVIIAVSVSSQSFMVTGTVIDETKELLKKIFSLIIKVEKINKNKLGFFDSLNKYFYDNVNK